MCRIIVYITLVFFIEVDRFQCIAIGGGTLKAETIEDIHKAGQKDGVNQTEPDEEETTYLKIIVLQGSKVLPFEGRSALRDPESLWRNGTVPYVISEKFGWEEKVVIFEAINEFHDKTCVRFVPHWNEKTSIQIIPGPGCSANVGKDPDNKNAVILGRGCLKKGVVMHELMHVLGFIHEHKRPDRDKFIRIDWTNIRDDAKSNFEIETLDDVTLLKTGYDYGSIMHYPPSVFAKDKSRPNIIPLMRNVVIGQRVGFSHVDRLRINKLHNCSKEKLQSFVEPRIRDVLKDVVTESTLDILGKGFPINTSLDSFHEMTENVLSATNAEPFDSATDVESSEILQEISTENIHPDAPNGFSTTLDDFSREWKTGGLERNYQHIEFAGKTTSSVEGRDRGNADQSEDGEDILEFFMEIVVYHKITFFKKDITFRAAWRDRRRLWDNGRIPYALSDKYDDLQKSFMTQAMDDFHNNSCVRFYPRVDEDTYIFIEPEERCSSKIGKVPGKVNRVRISEGCYVHGTILHELMHTLGFVHEQNRPDRDKYVTIMWDNIEEEGKRNFRKYSTQEVQTMGVPYDYQSLLHYSANEFAIDRSKLTVVTLKSGVSIGQRDGFSKLDIMKINRLYKCDTSDELDSQPLKSFEEFRRSFSSIFKNLFEAINRVIQDFQPNKS